MVRKRLSAIIGSLALVAALLIAAPAASAGRPANNPTWTVGPDLAVPESAALYDVSVLNAGDVWVVGSWSASATPLAARWSNGIWTQARPPEAYRLSAVDTVTAGESWVAGRLMPTGPGVITPLLARFAAGAWQAVPVTLPIGASGRLTDIDMLDSDSGWAVGYSTIGTVSQPLVLRYTAGVWQQLPKMAWAGDVTLTSAYASGPDDVWVAGTANGPGGWSALLMHWDGADWWREPTPDATPGTDQKLKAVSGNGAEIWAVGESCVTGPVGPICQAITLRREGQTWVSVRIAGQAGTDLLDVVVISATDVWVFGYADRPDHTQAEYVEHWDGVAFSVVYVRPMPPPADFPAAGLASASRVPGTAGLWAVGWRGNYAISYPNIVIYG